MGKPSYKTLYNETLEDLNASQLIIKGLEQEIKELQSKVAYLNNKIINGCKEPKRSEIKYINGYYMYKGNKYNSINEILKN